MKFRYIYNNSGIYQLKLLYCNKKYVSQTGHSFNQRYKEHINDIKTKKQN
jgi:hypothetical protein